MDFHGEIVFSISDSNDIEVDFGEDFIPSKIIKKGKVIALGRKTSQNRWLHIVRFNSEREYVEQIENLIDRLCERKNYINQLICKYEVVCVDIFIRSDFAEIGFSLPNHIIKKMALLDCKINFEILSFGMAIDKKM